MSPDQRGRVHGPLRELRRGVVHVAQHRGGGVPGRPRAPSIARANATKPWVYDRCADDVSDGGPLRRALQRRLLPVRVRPRGGHGTCSPKLVTRTCRSTIRSRRWRHPVPVEVLTQQLGDVSITVNSGCQDLTWIDQTFTQGDYEMSEIRDSASIMQYGCEEARAARQRPPALHPGVRGQARGRRQHLGRGRVPAAMSDLVHTFADLAWVTVISAAARCRCSCGQTSRASRKCASTTGSTSAPLTGPNSR